VTRVLVAAASPITRAGLEAILAREPSLAVVGNATTRTSLAEEIAEHEPDVLLVEFAGSDDDAIAMLHVTSGDLDDSLRFSPSVVVLADEADIAPLTTAFGAGVRGLLPRDARPHEIVAAVGAAAAGLVTVTTELLAMLRSAAMVAAPSQAARADAAREASLTPRELEVLRMIADGLGNKQIAARLAISEHTVKFHVGSVFAKTRASTRAEAVMIGARRGLIVL
jgi:two-component system, NarL family, response regulator YdfI